MAKTMTTGCQLLSLDSRLDEFDRLAAAIRHWCGAGDFGDDAASIILSADELFANIVLHGHRGEAGHVIEATVTLDDEGLWVTLDDDAPRFDPTRPSAPDTTASLDDRPIGGLGRHLVGRLMDRFDYSRDGNRNHVRFGREKQRGVGALPE